MMLPYLQDSKWPISKEPDERVVNPSPDKQFQDHLVGLLLVAHEKKNFLHVLECLKALIYSIESEEQNETSS